MPNDLKPLLQHIQWEAISTPDEAIELFLIGHAQHTEQCTPFMVVHYLLQKCPQFVEMDLRTALHDMIRTGAVMQTLSDGDTGPYEYLVWTGGAWDHKPEATPPEPTPHAYVAMHGTPATGFSIHGTWASANDAGDWADQNLAREYDYWVMPLVHAYP